MTDLRTVVTSIRRPRLLVRAARAGIGDYRRDRDLCRLMRTPHLPSPSGAVTSLLEEESALEETRRNGDASYSVLRHVEVMIALMAEARLLPRPEGAVH